MGSTTEADGQKPIQMIFLPQVGPIAGRKALRLPIRKTKFGETIEKRYQFGFFHFCPCQKARITAGFSSSDAGLLFSLCFIFMKNAKPAVFLYLFINSAYKGLDNFRVKLRSAAFNKFINCLFIRFLWLIWSDRRHGVETVNNRKNPR